MLVAVFDKVGNGAELDAVLLGEDLEIRAPGHGAVFVEDLDDDGGWLEAGQPGQIAARFGVAGAGQHTAILRHQREDVAGLHQIGGLGMGRHRSLHGDGAVGGGDAGGHPFRRLDGDGEGGGELGIVAIDHQRQRQLLAAIPGQGQADEATTVARHEVDVFRADTGGGHDQVPFVLPVFVIHQDHHLASLDIGNDFLGRAQRHGLLHQHAWGLSQSARLDTAYCALDGGTRPRFNPRGITEPRFPVKTAHKNPDWASFSRVRVEALLCSRLPVISRSR